MSVVYKLSVVCNKVSIILTIKTFTILKYLPNNIYIIGSSDWISKTVSRHTYTKNQRSNSEEKLQKQTFNTQNKFFLSVKISHSATKINKVLHFKFKILHSVSYSA